ncbi:hypothetical protein KEM48_000677 [Puccinia striiformis f. sp. tritici PST-130]|nr:hypothetical protein H4Q26_000975 [Puccinia striiformis f. sp. tritici PST-130]KAI9604558.1 hypothetical protein KEM48_000677 [Puccinia striiformis f. sp. tritici PST-130]
MDVECPKDSAHIEALRAVNERLTRGALPVHRELAATNRSEDKGKQHLPDAPSGVEYTLCGGVSVLAMQVDVEENGDAGFKVPDLISQAEG